ncbi:MAG TPA: universal stress protein [Deltaproteobacteria bacterium]|nr:universal stress protein [Deltaproteobacteria bacterium]
MFTKILYPTDFSDVAQKALKYIDHLKYAGAKEVIILHVIDIRSLELLVWDPENFKTIENDLRESALKKAVFARKHLETNGFSVKVRIETGIPASKILRVEKEEDVSVIVLGSHGRSNLKEMFLGSVSERVIRNAKAPIVVIKR